MAVSVGGNKRPRTGTRLSVDSSEDNPIGGRSATAPPRNSRPFSPANPSYSPRMNDESFDRQGNKYSDYLNERYGEQESPLRSLDIAGNEWANFLGDEITGNANLFRALLGQPLVDQYASPYNSFRRDPQRTDQYVNEGRMRADSPLNAQKRAQQELTAEEAKTLKDYLLEAEGMMGNGPDFEAIRRRYLENTQQSDAKLQAMFNQLNGSYAANAAPIQASYDTAGAAINQAGAQGVANVNAGYDASRAAQTEQLAALGIQDAAAVLAQDGEMAADQGMSAGGISRDAANYAGLNATNAQSAQQFNTGLQGAAALGGAESRALLQRSLADNLAGLAFKESEYEPQKFDMKMRLAQSLQAAEQGNGLDPYQQAQLDQDLAQFIADQQQQAYENSVGQSESQRDIFFRLLEQYQGDPQKLQEMYAWMQENGLR